MSKNTLVDSRLMGQLLSRRPLPAWSLLRNRLLPRGIGLRLGALRLGSRPPVLPFTLNGWSLLTGRCGRLG